MDGQTAAATLGVDPQATKDEIRRAFRARVKLAHPDAPGPAGSNEEFLRLRAAFEALLPAAPQHSEIPAVAEASSDRNPWQTSASTTPRSTFVLTDLRRPAPRVAGPSVSAVRADNSNPKRDKRGLSFGDHLEAALAR